MNNNKNVHQSGNEFSMFVGDLPQDCSDETLQRLFQSKFKSVKRVQIIRNEDGSSRGFGFIRFEDQTDFHTALSQEMKIGNTTLRLDTAHRYNRNRGRYNSFNSTVSNSSNHHSHHHFSNNNSNLHHHHHHTQSHHHHNPHHHPHPQHRNQHGNTQGQTGGSVNSKALLPDHTSGNQQHYQQQCHNQAGARNNSNSNNGSTNNNNSNQSHAVLPGAGQHHTLQVRQSSPSQQHQSAHLGHGIYNSNVPKNNDPIQPSLDSKLGPKQASLSQSGDDSVKSPNQSQQSQSQHIPSQQQTPSVPAQTSRAVQHALQQTTSDSVASQITGSNSTASTTTAATTTTAITSIEHSVASAASMHNSQSNLQATHQQAVGPDLRGYVQPAMIDSHLMGAGEPAVVPPTSVYGHMYSYGPPPPFSYMPPPPQPNPVMPISAVPPAPPNQASASGGVSQHYLPAPAAVGANRYNPSGQQHHHSQIHNHPQHQQKPHQQQQTHVNQSGVDATGLGAMPGGMQAPHQGPFYYYYHPSPLYFDQSGGASGAPPNHLYHPQTFHPQFFAVPNPAYMPNAHSYNQHQQQPPTASQSDASMLNLPPQHPQQLQVSQPPPAQLQLQQQQQQQTKDR